jgi:hypothetical protein
MRPFQFTKSARTALVYAIAGLIVGQLVLGVVVDQAGSRVCDLDYARQLGRLRDRRRSVPAAHLLIALGSSRTATGFRSGRIKPVVDGRTWLAANFGRPGAGPMVQLTVLRRLLTDGQKPDAVLVEIMPIYFNDQPNRLEDEKWLDDVEAGRYSAQEIRGLAHYCKYPATLAWRWGLARSLPCIRQRHDLQAWMGLTGAMPTANDEAADGTLVPITRVTQVQRRCYTVAVQAQYQSLNMFDHFRLAPQPAAALDNLLALCRRRQIRARLVLMPEGSAFRSLYSTEMKAGVAAYLANQQEKWGIGLTDATDWISDEGFSDSHHLLPEGGALFTDLLARELAAARWLNVPNPERVR